jgi:hypothetical protein
MEPGGTVVFSGICLKRSRADTASPAQYTARIYSGMVTGRDPSAGFGNSGMVAVEMAGPERG